MADRHGYIAFFNGKREEIYAASLYAAKLAALELFNVGRRRKVDPGKVSVVLAEKDGAPVVHDPAMLPA